MNVNPVRCPVIEKLPSFVRWIAVRAALICVQRGNIRRNNVGTISVATGSFPLFSALFCLAKLL